MTDTPDTTTPALPAGEPPPPHHLMRSKLVMLGGGALGVMALINLSLWWVLIQTTEPPVDITAMSQKMSTLDSRIARLEQKPPAPDLAPVLARIDALEKRPLVSTQSAPAPAGQTDQKVLDRITALEARPIPDLSALQNRTAALEQKPAIDPQFAGRVEALSGRMEALASKSQSAETELARRIDAADGRLSQLEGATGQAAAVAQKAARLAKLQTVESALNAGHPLGEIAGAPPALARFATSPPPTEAGLRLSFASMEKAVRAASHPEADSMALLDRMWDRAQSLVTVRQGDTVLLGDNVAGVLSRARHAIDAGDVAGAVDVLGALRGDPAKSAAAWVGQARALLDARAALADMAAKS